MGDLSLAVERPIQLNKISRSELEATRARLQQALSEVTEKGIELHTGTDEKYDLLERAYEKEGEARIENAPLSVKLRKLWSERGDFSKFRASTLVSIDNDAQDGLEADCLDYGAELEKFEDGKGLEGDMKREKDQGIIGTEIDLDSKDAMNTQDMLQLRTEMMERLGTAQNALYFSHALVSLLLNSTKLEQGPASGSSAARAGSPTSVSAAAGLRGETAASTSALQKSTTSMMGSSANLEAEIGVESHIFGASRLDAERRELETTGKSESIHDQVKGQDNEDDDGEENLDNELERDQIRDKDLTEIAKREKVEDLVDYFQAQREALNRARMILQRGASALRGKEIRNKSENFRWQTVSQARRQGWGLVADKPIRWASKHRQELIEDGNRRRDEPARDAWIGYAVPEAHVSYKIKSLAHVSHDFMRIFSANSGDNLEFAARSKKNLKVELVYQDEIWSSRDESQQATFNHEHLLQAQLEMFDLELFDAILVECRSILTTSSLYSSKINGEDSVSIWLGAIELRVRLEQSGIVSDGKNINVHESSFASSIVALLRLALIRRYRSQAGAALTSAGASTRVKTSEGSKIALLLPVIGPIYFAMFVSRIEEMLEKVKRADSRKNYEMQGLQKIPSANDWLQDLLQDGNESRMVEAVEQLGGSAIVFLNGTPVAFLTFAYPSDITLSLPTKQNSTVGSKGIHLSSCDLQTVESILCNDIL